MSGFLGMLFPGGAAGGGGPSEYLGTGGGTVGKQLLVYPWNSSTGFGTAYSPPTLSNATSQVSFVPDNSNVSIASANPPYFTAWPWSSLGFGTAYSNPSTFLNPTSGGTAGCTWTPTVDAVLTANITAPNFPQAWSWSAGSGLGTKYSNGTAISSSFQSRNITLNADGSLVAVSIYANLPQASIGMYPWNSSTGFGTRFSNPTTLPDTPTVYPLTLSFNRVTNDLIIAKNGSNFVAAYPASSSGFGTKYADPTTSFGGTPRGLRFSPDGASIATANTSFPPIIAFQWGSGFGSKYANPATIISYAFGMDWSNTNDAIAFGNTTAVPYVSVYRWSGGFGSLYSAPSVAPGNSAAISFSNQSR